MPKHIYLIAGEASGDFLGAQLMQSLKNKEPGIKFSGIGGPLMEAQGLKSFFPMEELSLMGIAEIVPKIKHLLGRIQETIDDVAVKRPDMVVTIDAPDFSFRVHKGIRKKIVKQPKLIHYVAPSVWAWRPERAAKISQFLDALICLFDFEPSYFEEVGLKAVSVGHPIMESGVLQARPALIGDNNTRKVGVFLGSRQSELKNVAPVIAQSLIKIKEENPDIELIVPTLPHLEEQAEEIIKPLDITYCISTDQSQKWEVFKACDIAIAVSGTVGLELAAANVPHLIAYRMNPITATIGRFLIKTPYVHLANIILSEELVPEFLQENCRPAKISTMAMQLLRSETERKRQKEGFLKVQQKIGAETQPSEKAAEFLLNL